MTDETPADDKNAVELTLVSDVVEAYEKIHYPIAKPTIGELIDLYLENLGITKRNLQIELESVLLASATIYRAELNLRLKLQECFALISECRQHKSLEYEGNCHCIE